MVAEAVPAIKATEGGSSIVGNEGGLKDNIYAREVTVCACGSQLPPPLPDGRLVVMGRRVCICEGMVCWGRGRHEVGCNNGSCGLERGVRQATLD